MNKLLEELRKLPGKLHDPEIERITDEWWTERAKLREVLAEALDVMLSVAEHGHASCSKTIKKAQIALNLIQSSEIAVVDESFKQNVKLAIERGLATALANEFEVAESTVHRWATGIGRPHPRLRERIKETIQKML